MYSKGNDGFPMSLGSVTFKVIFLPSSSMPPPDFTSFDLAPQRSHVVHMITTSYIVKCKEVEKGPIFGNTLK